MLHRKSRHTFYVQQRFSDNRALHETVWGKCGTAGQATDDYTTRLTLFACWIPKATNTHSEHVTLIAFPLQQWLYERLNVTLYVHCMSCFI